MKTIYFLVICIPLILPSLDLFPGHVKVKQHFVVLEKGQKNMTSQVRQLLYKAIAKGYRLQPQSVHVVREGKDTFLQWSLPAKDGKSHFISLKLSTVPGGYGFTPDGPLSLTNCLTTDDCECCTTECACSAKHGGQVNCGDSPCEEEPVKEYLPDAMTETLGG